MALKLDIEKAFDRLECNFLVKVFSCLGFNDKLIQLILQCISTVSYFIWLNGSPFGKFSPSPWDQTNGPSFSIPIYFRDENSFKII